MTETDSTKLEKMGQGPSNIIGYDNPKLCYNIWREKVGKNVFNIV